MLDPANSASEPGTFLPPPLEDVCFRFQQDWKAGRDPRVEDYLDQVPQALRDRLLRELSAIKEELARTCQPSTMTGASKPGTDTNPPQERSCAVAATPSTSGKDPNAAADFPSVAGYEILAEIGSGGMGKVYKARHLQLERVVALKVIRKDFLTQSVAVSRFKREARAAARLSHPNIVTLYDADESGEIHFLTMEFVEGVNLGEFVREDGTLAPHEACAIVRQVCLGLQHAHERGLVHRDIKPGNILISRDRQTVKILDLGLARIMSGNLEKPVSDELTHEGMLMGTPDYLAPEQASNAKTADIRADLYSLGCTFYFLLTGKPPFPGGSLADKLVKHAVEEPVPLTSLRPDISPGCADLVRRLLAKRPEARFATPAEVAVALLPFCSPVVSRPASPFSAKVVSAPSRGPWRFSDRAKQAMPVPKRASRKLGALGAGTVLLLAGAATAYWMNSNSQTPSSGDSAATPTIQPSGMPIKVGVLLSETGPLSIGERPVIDAIFFAIDEINANGGVLGRPVKAIVGDAQSNFSNFPDLADKLISEGKVCSVFGCCTSTSRKSVLPIFEKHNHLLFFTFAYEGLEQSPNVIYVGAAPNQLLIPAVKFCRDRNLKRLFLVVADSIFGRSIGAIIQDQAKLLGVEVVGAEYPMLGSTEVEWVADKVVATNPDVIVNTIPGAGRANFIRALRSKGVTSKRIPSVIFNVSEEELSALPPGDVAGDYVASNYFQCLDNPQNREFLSRFQKRYGDRRVVNGPMEASYCAVHLWANAVRTAGVADPAAIRKAVRGQSFLGPEGEIRIDPDTQHASRIVRLGQITDSAAIRVVLDSGYPIAPIPYPGTRSIADWDAFQNELYHRWGEKWSNESPTRR